MRSLEGSEHVFLFILRVYLWYGRTREVSGVNRSLHDECFNFLNVIPTVKVFFKFQIEKVKNNDKNITKCSFL